MLPGVTGSVYNLDLVNVMPILSWRCWNLSSISPYLHSLTTPAIWEKSVFDATCFTEISHQSPERDCSCGIYTMRSRISDEWGLPEECFITGLSSVHLVPTSEQVADKFVVYLANYLDNPDTQWGGVIHGLVALSGKVLAYKEGYRSSRGRIVALMSPLGLPPKVKDSLVSIYQVPVFDPGCYRQAELYADNWGRWL